MLLTEKAEEWVAPTEPGAGGYGGRYLWTDAFGVINFITLFKETGSKKYLILAKKLALTVHDVLGRTRDGSARLNGATESEPLRGGLRIGKMSADGSDGDGQYHHYLTLWMFALNRLSLATKDPSLNDLAIQLAEAIHPKFVSHLRSGDIKLVWKVSMDMKTILVPTEGHLDAVTGFSVYKLLQDTAIQQGRQDNLLQNEIEDYSYMMAKKERLSPSYDPLDLGMGLWVCSLSRDEVWAERFTRVALDKASKLLDEESGIPTGRATERLAFREFGACLGISCVDADDALQSQAANVIEFWGKQMEQNTTDDLKPISYVMYSAALIPGAFCREHLEN
ncbi:hypothetical protein PT974_03139 [Cladobotryum mycophilum]|uniref:Uncharacterized protein n=1 Tax=Cladobotryum mycophilum TaxID=491253 RepID=A0ABR0SSL1_9HYPO